jgi:hypothetical protein
VICSTAGDAGIGYSGIMSTTKSFSLDSLAIRLAADVGQVWSEMCSFPGYMRNVWRDEARQHVLREMPGAAFQVIACLDGDDIEYILPASYPPTA